MSFIQNTPEFKEQGDRAPSMGKHQFAPPLPGNREEWERLVARLTPHDPKNR